MLLNQKRANILILFGYAVLIILLVLVAVSQVGDTQSTDLGCRVVKLMYDFNTPRELADNQVALEELLAPEEFERLTVDNELRAVNSYYKFGYSKSHVRVLEYAQGYVLYQIFNSNIEENILWILQYDVGSDGRLCNIREYRLMNTLESEGIR